MKRIVSIGILLSLCIVPTLLGQESGAASSRSDVTIEDVYLQRQQTVEFLNRFAKADDPEMKMIVLKQLEEIYDEGSFSPDDEEFMEVLEYISTESSALIIRENNRRTNDYPQVRMMSCRLLGKVGGEHASKVLRKVLTHEDEPLVLSEAVYSLGLIGANDDGKVTSQIADMLVRLDIVGPDNNLAFASLLAIEKIAKTNNGIKDPDVLRAVLRLAQGDYIREVKTKAIEVFTMLRKYMN